MAGAAIAAAFIANGCAGVIAANGKNSQPTPSPSPAPGGATQQAQLVASPASASFKNVVAGSSSSQTITISNSGAAQATISQANVNGAGFSVSGLAMPTYIAAGQSASFSVTFSPATVGNASGSIAVVSDATNSPLMIAASGSAVAASTPALTSNANALNFGNVTVGSTNTLNATLTNTGTGNITVSGVTATGAGLSANGVSTNSVLTPGQSATLTVAYAPMIAGTLGGSVSVSSNAANSPLTITVSGSAAAAVPALSSTSSSLNFGSVVVGSNNMLGATLTNSGTANVTITGVAVTGTGFSASGINANTTLTPGQTAPINVAFTPQAVGSVAGSVAVSSNAPTVTINLLGIGGTASSHAVALTWDPSTSDVIGYNVYRAPSDGSSTYEKINTVVQAETQFTDQNILAGQEYMYVVTAVDSDNVESEYSDPAVADVP